MLRVCGIVHVLDFGEVIASGTPDEIRRNPAVQEAYLGHAPDTGGTSGAGPAAEAAER